MNAERGRRPLHLYQTHVSHYQTSDGQHLLLIAIDIQGLGATLHANRSNTRMLPPLPGKKLDCLIYLLEDKISPKADSSTKIKVR
jgi:hypothetical protein